MQYKSVFTFTSALLLVANVYALEPIHTGTVIVGSGISGLAAALDLNKYGQDVLVLEKMPFLGGTTNLAAQYFVSVNTREHQAAGKVLSVPDYQEGMPQTFLGPLKECMTLKKMSTG